MQAAWEASVTTSGGAAGSRLVLRRQIRLLPLVGLIYFSVAGGPFSLEESISSSGAGMTVVLIIVMPIIFAVPCSLMNAELGSALPLEGGYYAWVKIGLGKFWGFMEGMISWVSSWLDTALYPVIFVDYLATWFPDLQRGRHVAFSMGNGMLSLDAHWLVAIAFMVPLGYLNARGSRLVGDTSVGLLVIMLVPFVALVVLGFQHWLTTPGVQPFQPFTADGLSPRQAAGAGLAIMIWNYIGFDSVSTAGGEIDNPRSTYPRALLISVPLIMITYLLPVVAALASGLHAGDVTSWADGDFAAAGALLGGPWLQAAIVISAMVAQIGLFSSLLLSGSRVPAVLAADHYLPTSLARINPRTGTPITSIVVSCVIFSLFVALDFVTLIDADVILLLLAIVLEFAALIALRYRFPDMRRPFVVPFGWFGAIGVAVVPTLMVAWLLKATRVTEPGAFWIGVGLVVISAVLYPVLSRWAKRGRPDADLDVTGIDFGPGIDANAVVRGEWVRG
jgi:amino acid transporter